MNNGSWYTPIPAQRFRSIDGEAIKVGGACPSEVGRSVEAPQPKPSRLPCDLIEWRKSKDGGRWEGHNHQQGSNPVLSKNRAGGRLGEERMKGAAVP